MSAPSGSDRSNIYSQYKHSGVPSPAQAAVARVHAEQRVLLAQAQAAAWNTAAAAAAVQTQKEQIIQHQQQQNTFAQQHTYDPIAHTQKKKGHKPHSQQPYPPPHDHTLQPS